MLDMRCKLYTFSAKDWTGRSVMIRMRIGCGAYLSPYVYPFLHVSYLTLVVHQLVDIWSFSGLISEDQLVRHGLL